MRKRYIDIHCPIIAAVIEHSLSRKGNIGLYTSTGKWRNNTLNWTFFKLKYEMDQCIVIQGL